MMAPEQRKKEDLDSHQTKITNLTTNGQGLQHSSHGKLQQYLLKDFLVLLLLNIGLIL